MPRDEPVGPTQPPSKPEQRPSPDQGGAPGRHVSLVLGAGGARGYAHIGAIGVLRERGYEIVAVTGSSMGALVGGIFAADKLDEFADWTLSLHQRDVLRMVGVSLTGPGVMRAEGLLDRVCELVGDRRIEDLAVPFTAVATDLLAGREVGFQRGPLDIAIRASIALPGIFTPVMLNGRLLADGGLMEPPPVALAAATPADLTLAVSLTGERDGSAPIDRRRRHDRRAGDVLEPLVEERNLLPVACVPEVEVGAEIGRRSH